MASCDPCPGGSFNVERVNFRLWDVEAYQPIEDCPAAEWQLERGGFAAIQTQNGQPSMYCSPFNVFDFFNGEGATFIGEVEVDRPNEDVEECQALEVKEDDDYWGFALGYNFGDNVERVGADFLLIDWKARDQDYSESCDAIRDGDAEGEETEDCSPCECDDSFDGWEEATTGLAVSRVKDLIHVDEFWSHYDCPCGDQFPGTITELQRGRTLSREPWQFKKDKPPGQKTYKFQFDFNEDILRVYVDDPCRDRAPEITLTAREAGGKFSDGKLCFYNYSQENVRYLSFTSQEICPETLEPTSEPIIPPTAPTKPTTRTTKSSKGSGKGKGKGGSMSKGDDDDDDSSMSKGDDDDDDSSMSKGDDDDDSGGKGKGGSMSKGDDDDDDSSMSKGDDDDSSMSKGDDDDDDDSGGKGKGKGGYKPKGKRKKKMWKKKKAKQKKRIFTNTTTDNVFGRLLDTITDNIFGDAADLN